MNTLKNDLISVIVPVYRVEKYLNECVESILNQTYQNLEIILVDDGSPDRCPEMCDEYARKDSRVKVIHKENGGLSDARNAGIEIAQGEYLSFVDSDDMIAPEMLHILYERMSTEALNLVLCAIETINDSGDTRGYIHISDAVWNEQTFWENFYNDKRIPCVVAWNKLYKRELFNQTRYEVGRIHEDEFIIYDIVSQCRQVCCLSKPLYKYRLRDESITHSQYNIKNFEEIDAEFNRVRCFWERGKYNLAQLAFEGSFNVLKAGSRMLDLSQKENRETYILKREEFKTIFKMMKLSGASIRKKLEIEMFLIFPKLYNFISQFN